MVAKHRLFVWRSTATLPDQRVIAIARSDDTTFGILHSRFHELWSLRMGTSLEDRPRYTPTTTFETFPFPEGLTPRDSRPPSDGPPNHSTKPASGQVAGYPPALHAQQSALPLAGEVSQAIAAAAKQLNALRESWLNPREWVDWVRTPEEEQAGFPLRPVAKPRPLPNPDGATSHSTKPASGQVAGYLPLAGEGAKVEPTPTYEAELKKRTLTNLYNARPAWLAHAHRELDATVATAYGWTDYTPEMPDSEILRRLLALNLARTG